MFEGIAILLQQILVLFFMFALRLGLPLLIIFLVGAWLQKLLQEPETASGPERDAGNGIPVPGSAPGAGGEAAVEPAVEYGAGS